MSQKHIEEKEKAILRERTLQFKLKEAERQINEKSQSSGHVPDSNQSYGHVPYSTSHTQLPKPRPNAQTQYVTPRDSSKEIPRSQLRVQVTAGAPQDPPPNGGGGATVYHHIGTTPDVSSIDSGLTSPVPDEPLLQGDERMGRPWEFDLPRPGKQAFSPVRGWATAAGDARDAGINMDERV